MNDRQVGKNNRVWIIVLLVILALPLAGCANQGTTVVHVKMAEYTVQLDKTSIPAGPVKFVIENVGDTVHELVLEPAGANDEPFELNGKESEVEDVEPGKSKTLEWTLDQPGTYQLGCHTPAHFEQGMFTTFTVTAN